MKRSESVRKYSQRVKSLIQKLTTEIAPSVQVEWYVAGFLEEMGFHIRQTRPRTLREAMEAAQNYEDSAQSLRNALRRGERKSEKHTKKARRKRRYSKSSSSDSSSATPTSQSDSSSSDSDEPTGSTSRSRNRIQSKHSKAEKGKGVVKVIIEKDESKEFMKKVQESLEAIKVNLAENRNPRRTVPANRANIWCSRCQGVGHFPSECTKSFGRRINYVNQEGDVFYALPDEEKEEMELNPVFQIQPTYGKGRTPQQLMRHNTMNRAAPVGMNPSMPSQSKPYGFCFICGGADHYANVCPYRVSQGAPMVLPCQNCHEYGHIADHCHKNPQPKVISKQVEAPPREQTGLNYGSKTGIENPEK